MKTILVVDDELSIATTLSAVLEEEGYRVVTAANGREGLAVLPDARPDLVLCDVMMPLLDGREMCRTMQADAAYQSIPVVLMSAGGELAVKDKCNYAAFLGKPFDLDMLLETIAHLLNSRNSR